MYNSLNPNKIEKVQIEKEIDATSISEEGECVSLIVSWNYLVEDSCIYFIIKEWNDLTFSVEIEEKGLIVRWKVSEPNDSVWEKIGLSNSRIFYRNIQPVDGIHFIQSPKLLETHKELSEKIPHNDYRIIKIKLKAGGLSRF